MMSQETTKHGFHLPFTNSHTSYSFVPCFLCTIYFILGVSRLSRWPSAQTHLVALTFSLLSSSTWYMAHHIYQKHCTLSMDHIGRTDGAMIQGNGAGSIQAKSEGLGYSNGVWVFFDSNGFRQERNLGSQCHYVFNLFHPFLRQAFYLMVPTLS